MTKIKFTLFLLALFMIGWSANAQNVTIGENTMNGGYGQDEVPVNSSSNYSYSQQIYTKAQINTAGQITKISFYYVDGTTANSNNWDIYMGHTAKTSFTSDSDWVPVGSMTQVFSGNVTFPSTDGNWMEITLTTPFTYNNADNIVIAVNEKTPGKEDPNSSIRWGSFYSALNTVNAIASANVINPATALNGWARDATSQIKFYFAEACSSPSGIAASDITQNSASINWTSSASSWEIKYGESGFDFATEGTSDNITVKPYAISGLTAQTAYDVYVKAICGVGDESSWTGPFTFTTACGSITTFPWTESFEDVVLPNLPDCWSMFDADGAGTKWVSSSSFSHPTPGGKSLLHKQDSWDNSQEGWLFTPAFQLPTTDDLKLSFWSYNVYEDYKKNSVLISTSGTEIADFEEVWTTESVTENWVETNIILSAYSGQTVYFAFKFEGNNNSTHYWHIDDLSIKGVSNEKEILTFAYGSQTGPATFDNVNHNIDLEVSFITDITNLEPTITISEYATISPAIGEGLDFTNSVATPIIYTVTAEDGTTQAYAVTIRKASGASDQKDITAFTLLQQTGEATIGANTVDIEVNWQANITSLIPTITISALATINPLSGVEKDFSLPVEYIVTAQNSTTKTYTVNVTVGPTPLGANCSNPFLVNIPAGLPYEDLTQTNCGLGNVYNISGMPNGEDAIYEINVTADTYVKMTLDPKTSYGASIALFNECPPTTANLVAEATNGTGNLKIIETALDAGTTYYAMIKSSNDCMTEYDFTIEEMCAAPTNIEVSDITATTANIQWTAGGFETEWTIKVSTTELTDPSTGTGDVVSSTIVSTTPSYSLTLIESEIDYYVYIKANCNSDWTEYMFTTCPVPTDLTTTNIGENSATLTWNELGLNSWLIKVSTTPLTTPATQNGNVQNNTEVNGAVGTYALSELDANTTYYWYVKSACGSEWSDEEMFTTSCGAASIPYSLDFESIDDMTLLPSCTSIQNAGDGSNWFIYNNPGNGFLNKTLYYNYNPSNDANAWFYTQGIELAAGTLYRLTFSYGTPATSYTESLKVSYGTSAVNTDMTNEIVNYSSVSTAGTPNISTSDFTPSVSGIYYLGFNCYSVANQNVLYVDDILLEMSASCVEPTALTATEITTSSATISWTASASAPANGYEYYVSTNTTSPTGTTTATGTTEAATITANLSSLSANTTYSFWVRSNCDGTDFSNWSIRGEFTTDCEVISTFPHIEEFENGVPPACWNEFRTPSSTYGWETNANGVTGNCTRFESYWNSMGNESTLSSVTFDITSLTSPILKFDYKNPNGGNFNVLLSTDGGNTYTNTLASELVNQLNWTTVTYDLTSYSGTNVKIALVGISNLGISAGDAYIYVDNFTILEMPVNVDDITVEGIGIYPNPNNGEFTINFSNIEGDVTYQIYDTKGSIILSKNINTNGNTVEDVSVTLFPGVYYVKIITETQTVVQKLVIE
ncbi:MAG: choice-of-anchor J domain-containing protein [Bacteroidales bacterium]|nr:choice-of-anchor J domain-containing protein [Bacteroidales bacterium]